MSYQAYLGVFLHFIIGKVYTRCDFIFLDFKIIGRTTIHRTRPVLGTIHQLSATVDHRADQCDILRILRNQFTIPDLERLHIARTHADAATALVGTHHHDKVGAHVGKLVGRALLQALAQIDHSDDSSNADNNAKHGKSRARLVAQQSFRRYPYEVQNIHISNRFQQARPRGHLLPTWSPQAHHGGCDHREGILFCL